MNHYPHHIGDFNNATRHLTRVERSLYRDLLDLYYDTEQPLSSDPVKLARRVIAVTEEERVALAGVLEEFFELQDDGWHNMRCDAEIARYQGSVEQASRAGRASAAKRAGNTKPEHGSSAASASEAESNDRSTAVQRPFNDRSTNQNQNQNQNQVFTPPPPDQPTEREQVAVCTLSRAGDGEQKPNSPAQWIEVFAAEHGVHVDHRSVHDRKKFFPIAAAWVQAGVTVGQMRDACAKAHADASEPIAWLPAYADRVLAGMAARRLPAAGGRAGCGGETFRERDARNAASRVAEFAPGVARRMNAADVVVPLTMELEACDVFALESR